MPAPKGNRYAVGNRGGPGNISPYKPKYAVQAARACQAGFTDRELADLLGVHDRTIRVWKREHPEFAAALKPSKAETDERVARSLYHRAIGYTYDAVKIFMPAGSRKPVLVPYREHVPPDPTSMIFWLKNRQPTEWRDRHEFIDNTPIDPQAEAKRAEAMKLVGAMIEERARLGLPPLFAKATPAAPVTIEGALSQPKKPIEPDSVLPKKPNGRGNGHG